MTKIPGVHLVLCFDLILFHSSSPESEYVADWIFTEPNYENISSLEFFKTERRRELNKYYSKSASPVTHRISIDWGAHTLAICRCWKSGKFPFCDNSHKLHNRFHKDNVGPFYVDGPTLPDEVLDRYTRPTPDRSITLPTERTPSESEAQARRDKHVAEHMYSDDSGENSTRWEDKNDFFERVRRYPPGLGPQTAKFGWS